MTISKKEIVRLVAEKDGIPMVDAKNTIDAYNEVIFDLIERGEDDIPILEIGRLLHTVKENPNETRMTPNGNPMPKVKHFTKFNVFDSVKDFYKEVKKE